MSDAILEDPTLKEHQRIAKDAGYTAAVHAVRACAAWITKAGLNPKGYNNVDDAESWQGLAEEVAQRMYEEMRASIENAYREGV